MQWRQKFIGLLPEVHRRRLYEKKGYCSIFEFAAKLTGISQEQVRRTLNLEEKFGNLPLLKEALTNGEISVNKLARIASIANAQNEEQLATQAKLLSNRALETFVHDIKNHNTNSIQENDFFNFGDKTQNGFNKTKNEGKSVHVHAQSEINRHQLQLPKDLEQKLLELQNKGIDIGGLLREFLKEREEKIQQEKEKIAAETKTTSRYIPIKIKKIIDQEFGTKCSIQNCYKSATQLHHTQRYALAYTHDPYYLAPLCKEHHQIAHTIDMRFHEVRLRR